MLPVRLGGADELFLATVVILPVPVLTPGLSSHWVGLVTPVPNSIARPLVESLRHEVVCAEHDSGGADAEYIPDPVGGLVGFDEAVALALTQVRRRRRRGHPLVLGRLWSQGLRRDPLPTDQVVGRQPLRGQTSGRRRGRSWRSMGRDRGDRLERTGGIRSRWPGPCAAGWTAWSVASVCAGASDPKRLRVGDSLDFWRVEEIDRERLLRLRAEMRLPGQAWLELSVGEPDGRGRTRYGQRALFHPRGPGRSPVLVEREAVSTP